MMDQSGGVLPRNGLAENKLQAGRDDGDRRRGRNAGARAVAVAEYFDDAREAGHQHQLRQLLQRDAGAQRRARHVGPRSRTPAELDRMRAIMDTAMRGGAMGMTTALIYPPSELRDDRRADRGGEGRREVRRRLREPHSRRRPGGRAVGERSRSRSARRAGMPVEVFHLKVAHKPGWGMLHGFRARMIDRRGARARRGRRGRSLRLHGGRHWTRGDDSELGVRGRQRFAQGAARESRRSARVSSASRRPARRAGGTSSRRRAAGTASCSSTRATRTTRSTSRRRIAQIARSMNKDPADAAMGSRVAGQRPRDGDLPHDGRAGHRDGAQVSVDEHRQRRRRRRARRPAGRDRACRTRARFGNARA